ncbi:hypothetical protein FisN_9Hh395 [Fistulifera solaris]|jgi:hypothetical protein|uniref:Uncharacterized protein n=1 Tax=Fistulifera solaris TaxID=1519565 RepID=A0A1Z5KDE4_FISSO|nr:hypothetical protein FisN_9Hh395 [Fistulifera solaris]|eukprot:GAX24142.1 hypothetical protein FisN_9Hh395 [Fistulifera solaris]
MTEVRGKNENEEEGKSVVSISLDSEFFSLITTQEDLTSRSDSCVTKPGIINTSFPDYSSSCNDLLDSLITDDQMSSNHVDIRTDIDLLWQQKKELEKALREAKQKGLWTKAQPMQKSQYIHRPVLPRNERKWDADTCDRFQLRPIRVKTNDSVLKEIAMHREELRAAVYRAKGFNDAIGKDATRKGSENITKPIHARQSDRKRGKDIRHVRSNQRKHSSNRAQQRASAKAPDEGFSKSAGLIMSAMMWVSRSSWWGATPSDQATQIRIPPPNRRI